MSTTGHTATEDAASTAATRARGVRGTRGRGGGERGGARGRGRAGGRGTGRGRAAGTRNWTAEEDNGLLDFIDEFKPAGRLMWEDLVAAEYNDWAEILGFPERDVNAQIARYKKVSQ